MKSNFYKEGYDLTLANVKSLIRISKKAAETEDFGIACSLNVLAAEEALKALFLIIKHYNPERNIINFEKIFRFHSIKHYELSRILQFHNVIQAIIKEHLSKLEPILNGLNNMAADYIVNDREILNSLNEEYIWFKKQSQMNFDLGSILTWLKHANHFKNKGLYVDKLNETWISPSDISREKYEMEKNHAQSILDHVLNLEQTFERVEKSKNLH